MFSKEFWVSGTLAVGGIKGVKTRPQCFSQPSFLAGKQLESHSITATFLTISKVSANLLLCWIGRGAKTNSTENIFETGSQQNLKIHVEYVAIFQYNASCFYSISNTRMKIRRHFSALTFTLRISPSPNSFKYFNVLDCNALNCNAIRYFIALDCNGLQWIRIYHCIGLQCWCSIFWICLYANFLLVVLKILTWMGGEESWLTSLLHTKATG